MSNHTPHTSPTGVRQIAIWLLFLTIPIYAQAQQQGQALADSLLHELPRAHNDTNKVKLLNTLSYTYFFINTDNGIAYGRQALTLAQQLHWQKGIATAHKNTGNSYMNKASYDTALQEYALAQQGFEAIHDQDGTARVLGNIGSIYDNLGDYTRALEYELQALKIYEATNNSAGKGRIYGTIGNLYEVPKKYAEALRYHTMALNIHTAMGDKQSTAIDLGNMGIVYTSLREYKKALDLDQRSLKVYEELRDSSAIANKLLNIGTIYADLNDDSHALQYWMLSLKMYERVNDKDGTAIALGSIGDKYMQTAKSAAAKAGTGIVPASARADVDKAITYTMQAIAIFRQAGELDQLQYNLENLATEQELAGNYRMALDARKEFQTVRDSILTGAKDVKFANLEKQRAVDERKMAEQEKETQMQLNDLLSAKKRNETLLFGAGTLILLAGIVLVIRQRKKTEQLLLNILPGKIAARLKKNEHPIADHFADVSIIFIDMAGFTTFSQSKDPKIVVDTLNDVFTRFDAIAGRHGLEKIKTIGDCYMAVAGLPEPAAQHPQMAANMALEIRDSMAGYTTADGTMINFRTGIECGPVVAGVIGKKKFIYDIWGDAVNTASRMESSGVAGEIHCTDNFRKRLQEGYTFTSRGEINVKSKGVMHTWLLTGKA